MSLYIVQHMHAADRCPAQDSTMAPMLLKHLANSKQFGVNILSEAVADGKHTLYLLLKADSKESVNNFMQPFAQAGSVEIIPASPCEVVVGRGVC